jgi:drug/metabolite transporter (DMT)-like permease
MLCLVAGAGGVSIYFLFENYALTYTYASNVSIIVATAPFLTGLLARIVYKERLKRGFMLGFVLSIAGIILITLNGSMELHLNPFGDLLAIGASLCWAFYSIATVEVKRPEYSSIALTRRIFFYGLVTMLPLMPLTGFRFDPESLMMPRNIGLYLYLGVMASGLCYITWNKAMEILGAVRTTVYIYLVPVVTLIFSYFVLGERLTAVSLFGCAVILAGLIMSERK